MLILLLILLVFTSPAFAGSYTVTTTPEQEEAIKTLDERRVARGLPKLTVQQTLQHLVDAYTAVTVADLKRSADKKAACAKVTDAQAKQHLGCAP